MLNDDMRVRPSVIICTAIFENCENRIRELQAGLEEEGVPYTLLNGKNHEAVGLAWEGANASRLGVGLGVCARGLCIHYHKLAEYEPLFILDGLGNEKEWRRFGANAARLVKGLPFKTETARELSPEEDLTQLYSVVREIVIRVLQENTPARGR